MSCLGCLFCICSLCFCFNHNEFSEPVYSLCSRIFIGFSVMQNLLEMVVSSGSCTWRNVLRIDSNTIHCPYSLSHLVCWKSKSSETKMEWTTKVQEFVSIQNWRQDLCSTLMKQRKTCSSTCFITLCPGGLWQPLVFCFSHNTLETVCFCQTETVSS